MTLTVAVTGVGAIIGHGIVKCLRASGRAVRVIGVDRNPDAFAARFCDIFAVKPGCDETSTGYLDFWRELVAREGIKAILPGLDIDVGFLAGCRGMFADMGVALCLNTDALIAIGQDKWALDLALRAEPELEALAIPAMIDGDWDDHARRLGTPPWLMKPRRGSAGRGIVRIGDPLDLEYWRHKAGDDFMLQRIVGRDDNEFTVGVFGDADGQMLPPIVFRRRLSAAGNTGYAEVVDDAAIVNACHLLTRYFKPLGPTNYQFRREGDRLYLLEINPRFSSSTSLRTAFGYNEAAMALDFYLDGSRPAAPVVTGGRAWRYIEDVFDHDWHSV